MLHKPSNFDPSKKYPLLVSVYAGPATNAARETFATPNPLTEFGFLVAAFDSRSAAGRGKKFLDAIYQKLGRTEIDDQAAGVEVAPGPALRRHGPRRHLRHLLRRLRLDPLPAPPPRRLPGRLRVVAA